MDAIRVNIGPNKSVVVRRNGQFINCYINDNYFEEGKLVPAKSKAVWLKYVELLKLRDAINKIERQLNPPLTATEVN